MTLIFNNYCSRSLFKKVTTVTIDFWDKILKVQRQLLGPHSPHITNTLVCKWNTIKKSYSHPMPTPMVKQWFELSKELERELNITHGRQHPDYNMISTNINDVYIIADTLKL